MAQLKVLRQTPQRVKRRSAVSPMLWEFAQGDPAVALKTMQASLSMVGRNVAELLHCHPVRKALVSSTVQDMIIAKLEA